MKNFKKIIFLSIIVVLAVIYLIYNYSNNENNEIIEEDLYIETSNQTKENNKIILHMKSGAV